MSIQSLSPPQDIAWKRLAFSRDMIDTNFGDLKFPPKWRSSLAVYYFIVPEEETADEYPNSRIVYLRLTCSITGWNPNEELVNASGTVNVNPDEIQVSIWETITNDGWASVYWPCYGAIMQIAIYPPKDSIVGLDDYPEIMDFEPKKRELYESVTEGEEQLSSSSNKNSIGKSNTSTFSVEAELHATGPIGGALVGGGVKTGFGRQSVDTNNTDTSRENRETKSRTTSFSQMYQLFNGYHLGTNRAVFVVVPRPNIKSSEFILIDDSGGGRVLEGIQDVFLVVNIPKKLKGFCVQASIDTGHKVMANNMIAMENERQPNGEEEDPPIHPTNPGQPPNPDQTYQELIVTRRIVRNCGNFDDNGNFTVTGTPTPLGPGGPSETGGVVVWEDSHVAYKRNDELLQGASFDSVTNRGILAKQMNIGQRRFIRSMISGFTAGNFEPVEFVKTKTFRRQVRKSLQKLNIPVDKLVQMNHITIDEANLLMSNHILTLGDIFKDNLGQSNNPDIRKLRRKILDKAGIKSPSQG